MCLVKVNPSENINRWYWVKVQSTLFDPVAVVCGWGRRDTRYSKWRIFPTATWEEATVLAGQIIKKRLNHGYTKVTR